MFTRRVVLAGLAVAVFSPRTATAQSRPRLAFLTLAKDETRPAFRVFRNRLNEFGWIEGHNFDLRFYFAGGGGSRVAPLAAEVAASGATIVLADGRGAMLAMLEASRSMPIIAVSGIDPTGAGLASSFAHPSANMTGITLATDELNPKRLELLRELCPWARQVGVIYSAGREDTNSSVFSMGATLGFTIRRFAVNSVGDVGDVLSPVALSEVDAVAVSSDALLDSMPERIVTFVNAARKPAIYPEPSYAKAGGLLAYGIDMEAVFRRLAELVDQSMRGRQIGEMPIEQWHRVSIMINMKAAREAGHSIPDTLYIRADEVIE